MDLLIVNFKHRLMNNDQHVSFTEKHSDIREMGRMISHFVLFIKAFELATGNPVSAITDKYSQNYGSLKKNLNSINPIRDRELVKVNS